MQKEIEMVKQKGWLRAKLKVKQKVKERRLVIDWVKN